MYYVTLSAFTFLDSCFNHTDLLDASKIILLLLLLLLLIIINDKPNQSNQSLLSSSNIQVLCRDTNKNTDEINIGTRLQSAYKYHQ